MPSPLSPQLCDIVRRLEKDIAAQQREEDAARGTASRHETEATQLYDGMNFREKYLRGWFGGDTGKVGRYREAVKLTAQFNAAAESSAARREELYQQAHDTLDDYLRQNDDLYRAMREPWQKADAAKAAIDDYMRKVQSALSSIDSAQGMETMDMFSKNKGISLMSSMSNASARAAVDTVKSATPAFQKAMQDYGDYLKDYKVPAADAAFGDMTDFVFDMAFDTGFDFMSMFSLSALGNAEDKMEDVRDKVREADSFVSGNRAKISQSMAAYRNRIRTLCL